MESSPPVPDQAPSPGGSRGAKGGIGRRILWISLVPLGANLIGTAFNIWYNLAHLRPLLTELQREAFSRGITWFNILVYPVAFGVWIVVVKSIAGAWKEGDRESRAWGRATRRVINLPWICCAVSGAAWMISIPFLLAAVHRTPDAVDPQVLVHLPISIVIAAMISIAHSFFAVEILTQRMLYPLFLSGSVIAQTEGTIPITLRRRGVIWVISAVVCPVVSLMLLFVAAVPDNLYEALFPLSVGALGIAFGFASAWLLARIVVDPVEALRHSARKVGEGGLDADIDLLHTDEFGALIGQFNEMVAGLREKRRVEEIFGRNVGLEVARLLLEHDEEFRGSERHLSILFTDIRDFTPRCAEAHPEEVVTLLNIFFDVMVPEVESRDGIVTNFVGDGFMAVFGAIGEKSDGHEDKVVAAGRAMLEAVERVNEELADRELAPLAIGVGIHTGPAVIGSIGASGRTSYTAIGDTVNVTARIESLTKEAGYPLLLSSVTYEALKEKPAASPLSPMKVKGKTEPVMVYGMR